MRQLCLAVLTLAGSASSGCDFTVNVPQLEQAAKALDNFSKEIEKTTEPDSGNLRKLVDHTSGELKQLIKEAKEAGKEVVTDAFVQFAAERAKTFEEIHRLTKKVFGDANILLREFQGVGISVPLAFEDSLKRFSKDFRQDIGALLTATPFVGDHPVDVEGLVWSARATGKQQVTFTVKQAHNLDLVVEGQRYAPKFGGLAGRATYEIPVTALADRFHDTEPCRVSFGLIERGDVKPMNLPVRMGLAGSGELGLFPERKKNTERIPVVGGGWFHVLPRFAVEDYKFTYFTPDDTPGKPAYIIGGTGMKNLLDGLDGEPVAVATRRGELFDLARSRLPLGTSIVELPKGASWKLEVKARDHDRQILSPGKRRVDIPFGTVTVHGPESQEGKWVLLIEVELKK